MNHARRASDRRGAVERHIQSILAVIMAGLIAWVGTSIVSLRSEVSIATARIEAVREQLKQFNDERYPAVQALSDFKLRDQRIEENTRRIADLETKRQK